VLGLPSLLVKMALKPFVLFHPVIQLLFSEFEKFAYAFLGLQ